MPFLSRAASISAHALYNLSASGLFTKMILIGVFLFMSVQPLLFALCTRTSRIPQRRTDSSALTSRTCTSRISLLHLFHRGGFLSLHVPVQVASERFWGDLGRIALTSRTCTSCILILCCERSMLLSHFTHLYKPASANMHKSICGLPCTFATYTFA